MKKSEILEEELPRAAWYQPLNDTEYPMLHCIEQAVIQMSRVSALTSALSAYALIRLQSYALALIDYQFVTETITVEDRQALIEIVDKIKSPEELLPRMIEYLDATYTTENYDLWNERRQKTRVCKEALGRMLQEGKEVDADVVKATYRLLCCWCDEVDPFFIRFKYICESKGIDVDEEIKQNTDTDS